MGAIVRKFRNTGTIKNKKRIGRPRKTTTAEDRRIVTTSKRNRRLTAPEIASQINESRIESVSIATVKRRFNEKGLYGRIAVKKPLLRLTNKKKRLEWANQHKDWTTSDWNKVLWMNRNLKFSAPGGVSLSSAQLERECLTNV